MWDQFASLPLAHTLTIVAGAGLGPSQESGTLGLPHVCQKLELYSVAFAGALARSWMRNRVAET